MLPESYFPASLAKLQGILGHVSGIAWWLINALKNKLPFKIVRMLQGQKAECGI